MFHNTAQSNESDNSDSGIGRGRRTTSGSTTGGDLKFPTSPRRDHEDRRWITDGFARGAFTTPERRFVTFHRPHVRYALDLLTQIEKQNDDDDAQVPRRRRRLDLRGCLFDREDDAIALLRGVARLCHSTRRWRSLVVATDLLRHVVTAFSPGSLRCVELHVVRRDLSDKDLLALRRLMRVPTGDLTLVMETPGLDVVSTCLEPLRRGLDDPSSEDDEREEGPPPRVHVRNARHDATATAAAADTSLDGRDATLLRQLTSSPDVVTSLELLPPDDRTRSSGEDATVATAVRLLRLLTRLLRAAPVGLRRVELRDVSPSRVMALPDALLTDLREAFADNTTLECFSMATCLGLDAVLWTRVLFPALVKNRTLHTLELGCDADVEVALWRVLPQLHGLHCIRLPWRPRRAAHWLQLVRDSETVTHVEYYGASSSSSSEKRPPEEQAQIEAIHKYCRRNQLIAQARQLLRRYDTTPAQVMDEVAACGREESDHDEVGLSAMYILCREFAQIVMSQ